mmetsp:Transcript_42604/g.110071  ORF Transcript_42604/g.110071 Transcript_42604/m.110071 type:complete len:438 (-) Transcript_42604:85-1398(-)
MRERVVHPHAPLGLELRSTSGLRAAHAGHPLVRQAGQVDLQGRRLVPEVLLKALPALLQVLEVGFLELVMPHEVLMRLEHGHAVLLELRGHRIRDVLSYRALLAPRGTRRGQVHGLLQGLDLVPRLRDRGLRVLHPGHDLLHLGVQALPHRLDGVDALLHLVLGLGRGILRGLLAAHRELAALLAQRLRGLLAARCGAVHAGGLLLAQQLVLAALVQGDLVPHLLHAGWQPAGGRRGRRALDDGLVAALRRAQAHLVHAQSLVLLIDVLPELLQVLLELEDIGLRPPHGLAQLPLLVHEDQLLLLQRDLHHVAHLLAQGAPLALFEAPHAQLQGSILVVERLVEHVQGVLLHPDAVVDGLGPLDQPLDEPVRVVHLLRQALVQLVIHAEVGPHGVLVRLFGHLALPGRRLVRALRLRHVHRGMLMPFLRRVHARRVS